jgi:hypothetical protein
LGLFVYTRHTTDCPKKSDRFWKRCRCPKWIRGVLNGSTVRQTAETRSWEKAEDKRRRLEEEVEQLAGSAGRLGASPVRIAAILRIATDLPALRIARAKTVRRLPLYSTAKEPNFVTAVTLDSESRI